MFKVATFELGKAWGHGIGYGIHQHGRTCTELQLGGAHSLRHCILDYPLAFCRYISERPFYRLLLPLEKTLFHFMCIIMTEQCLIVSFKCLRRAEENTVIYACKSLKGSHAFKKKYSRKQLEKVKRKLSKSESANLRQHFQDTFYVCFYLPCDRTTSRIHLQYTTALMKKGNILL